LNFYLFLCFNSSSDLKQFKLIPSFIFGEFAGVGEVCGNYCSLFLDTCSRSIPSKLLIAVLASVLVPFPCQWEEKHETNWDHVVPVSLTLLLPPQAMNFILQEKKTQSCDVMSLEASPT